VTVTESILGQDGGQGSSQEADVDAAYGDGDQTAAALGGSAGGTGADGDSHGADIDAGYEDSSDSPTEGESGLDLDR
jgi:hypothetical protein